MADKAFDPAHLTVDASLNQVDIGSLPGVHQDIVGQRAGDVCSRDALADLVRQAAPLPEPEPDRLANQLASLADSPDPDARAAAASVLGVFGRRLGALIATLTHPTTSARQGLSPARRAYLEHWLSIRTVVLTGGLIAGPIAGPIIDQGTEVITRSSPRTRVEAGPWAHLAPMVGAARTVDTHDGRVLLLDCGHSTLKPGVAEHRNGSLTALRILPASPAPPHGNPELAAAAVAGALTEAAATATLRGPIARQVVLSVASYLHDGHPIDDTRSVYGRLGESTGALGALVETVVGHPVAIVYLHDGTAAASATTRSQPAAVITVGTWLGVGFVPPQQPLLTFDETFEITDFHET